MTSEDRAAPRTEAAEPRTETGRYLLDHFGPAPAHDAQELHRRSAEGRRTKLRTAIVAIEREAAAPGAAALPDAETLAAWFHEIYERLAPVYHYGTRPESAVSWKEVPTLNKGLMIATAREILGRLTPRAAEPKPPESGDGG